ncbi:MAG: ABC transporter permease [Bacteroidales bacterium]|jgi:phospholipid/cholesterol/gamma-HCH transport system permease protein|nr:ABC transporter permease [Bacteroidales bacterium]NLM93472.1 ABC transporter permease [Bacteroidales bacterium]
MKFFYHLGRYLILMGQILKKPEKASIYRSQIILEMDNLGLQSLGIVAIISVFMGAVVTIQTALNTDHPLLPRYAIGFATRQSIILEFAPTVISLILAGKVGSRIASEIGTMRVTEQIDALEIMGVNASGFLILPKVVAAVLMFPILVTLSMFLGIFGGWVVSFLTGVMPVSNYIYGILYEFAPYDIFYALVKTVVFAYLITTISGYYGFYTKGGALEVGQASTNAVVTSSIFIILFNLVLTQLLLV